MMFLVTIERFDRFFDEFNEGKYRKEAHSFPSFAEALAFVNSVKRDLKNVKSDIVNYLGGYSPFWGENTVDIETKERENGIVYNSFLENDGEYIDFTIRWFSYGDSIVFQVVKEQVVPL